MPEKDKDILKRLMIVASKLNKRRQEQLLCIGIGMGFDSDEPEEFELAAVLQ